MATAYFDVLFQAFAEVRYGNSMDMASGNNLCSGNIGHMLPKGHRRLLPNIFTTFIGALDQYFKLVSKEDIHAVHSSKCNFCNG